MAQGFSRTKELRPLLRAYRKKHKTMGFSLGELYRNFCSKYPEKKFSEDLFQMVLLLDGAQVAKNVAEKCKEYAAREGKEGYKKFVIEQQKISRQFWNKVVSENARSYEVGHQKKTSNEGGVSEGALRKKSDGECYEKLMPVGWLNMDLPKRIKFAQRIQHKGFRKYVLEKDPRLKEKLPYLERQSPIKYDIYVTLFTFPSENYSEEAKNLLKVFIETLNQFGRAKLQWTELSDPPKIEIRETR